MLMLPPRACQLPAHGRSRNRQETFWPEAKGVQRGKTRQGGKEGAIDPNPKTIGRQEERIDQQ